MQSPPSVPQGKEHDEEVGRGDSGRAYWSAAAEELVTRCALAAGTDTGAASWFASYTS